MKLGNLFQVSKHWEDDAKEWLVVGGSGVLNVNRNKRLYWGFGSFKGGKCSEQPPE